MTITCLESLRQRHVHCRTQPRAEGHLEKQGSQSLERGNKNSGRSQGLRCGGDD